MQWTAASGAMERWSLQQDLGELRVFFEDRFVCRAICPELSGQTVSLKEIVAARQYLKRGEPLPEEVPMFEGILSGPYLKYRWQEESDGVQYTIQMGQI